MGTFPILGRTHAGSRLGARRWRAGHRVAQYRQRGMAVVSALLIVALIAVLAAVLVGRQAGLIRGAQNEQTRMQGRWLLRGELSAAQVLLRSEAQRSPVTRLDGAWRVPVVGQPVQTPAGVQAHVSREIVDEQGLFNLRNLVKRECIDPDEVEAFERLAALLGVPPQQAHLIVRRTAAGFGLADQLPDSPPTRDELERAAQMAEQRGVPPRLPATAVAPRLRSVDDLMSTPSLGASVVARLRPYVTVLPERTWINANTASAEVLAARVPGLSLERARAMLEERDRGQWFINRSDFVNRLRLPELIEQEVHIGITSNWFRMAGVLETPDTRMVLQALLHDDKQSLPRPVWLREGV